MRRRCTFAGMSVPYCYVTAAYRGKAKERELDLLAGRKGESFPDARTGRRERLWYMRCADAKVVYKRIKAAEIRGVKVHLGEPE